MTKQEIKLQARRAYIASALAHLKFGCDTYGTYILVPSSTNPKPYMVRFNSRRGNTPRAYSCTCGDFFFRHHACKHMLEIVDVYFRKMQEHQCETQTLPTSLAALQMPAYMTVCKLRKSNTLMIRYRFVPLTVQAGQQKVA